jgi:transposase
MRQSLRRQFLFLRAYAITSSLILVVLAATAFRQAGPAKNAGEITASASISSMRTARFAWCSPARTACTRA